MRFTSGLKLVVNDPGSSTSFWCVFLDGFSSVKASISLSVSACGFVFMCVKRTSMIPQTASLRSRTVCSPQVLQRPVPEASRLGLGTETRYLCNRYVLEPNQNADFGASLRCPTWAIGWNICPLFLRNGRKKHHHQQHTFKIISRLRRCTWTQFGKL